MQVACTLNKIDGQPGGFYNRYGIKAFNMLVTLKNYIKSKINTPAVIEKSVVAAYDAWAAYHDSQPGNLMLELNDKLFAVLVQGISFKGKTVADIGCGTGRQWPLILAGQPDGLTGFDVSGRMLKKLQEKYPQADARLINDNLFSGIPDASFDIIVSTLTVAHIEYIEEAMQSWTRLLTPGGHIIITDFHPHMLALGGKRTFRHNKKVLAIRSYINPIYTIKDILLNCGCSLIAQEEIRIDETMKPFYQNADAMHVYEKYRGFPVIYGIHLTKDR
ncbi:MAG TPA: class I SAM-dependent methyltransferase [Mucilaginibacter sp.]